jgi:polyhydroxyalkanoate synthesis regulator phasin
MRGSRSVGSVALWTARRAAQRAQHQQRMQRMSAASAAWQQRIDQATHIFNRAAEIQQAARSAKPATAPGVSSWGLFGRAAPRRSVGLSKPVVGRSAATRIVGQPTIAAPAAGGVRPTSRPFARVMTATTPAQQINAKLAQAKAILATGDTKAAADATFEALQIYNASNKAALPGELSVLMALDQMTTQIETVKAQQTEKTAQQAAELADWEQTIYDQTGVEVGNMDPSAAAVGALRREDAELEALIRSMPEPPTHDPNQHSGSGSGPGGGMSEHEANRRAQEMIRQVERDGGSLADGMAELMDELADDRHSLAALGKQAGAASSSKLFYTLGQQANELVSEAHRMLDRGPGCGG